MINNKSRPEKNITVDLNKVTLPYKPYSDASLATMKRELLIKRIRDLEFQCKIMIYYIDQTENSNEKEGLQGKWVYVGRTEYTDCYRCSNCGRKIYSKIGVLPNDRFPFCHCGSENDSIVFPYESKKSKKGE